MPGVSVFVLAGGKSSRMGTDKAFLPLAGRTLFARALELASSISQNVSIVGDPDKFVEHGTVIRDVYSERGPLGGIHAALCNSSSELNLMIGVDLPFLEVAFLKFLLVEAESSHATVTVPFVRGHYEPLCAVYRKEFTEVAERALARGQNKIDALFDSVTVRTLDERELATAGWSSTIFRNLNTPEDFSAAQQELEARAQHL